MRVRSFTRGCMPRICERNVGVRKEKGGMEGKKRYKERVYTRQNISLFESTGNKKEFTKRSKYVKGITPRYRNTTIIVDKTRRAA